MLFLTPEFNRCACHGILPVIRGHSRSTGPRTLTPIHFELLDLTRTHNCPILSSGSTSCGAILLHIMPRVSYKGGLLQCTNCLKSSSITLGITPYHALTLFLIGVWFGTTLFEIQSTACSKLQDLTPRLNSNSYLVDFSESTTSCR